MSPARARGAVACGFGLCFWLGITSWAQLASAADEADHGDAPEHTSKRELTVLPTVGGTSDIGFGGGYVVSWAKVGARVEPY